MTTLDTVFDRETVTKFLAFLGEENMPDGCEMAVLVFRDRYEKLLQRFPTLEQGILFRLLRKAHIVELIDDDKLTSIPVTLEDFFGTEPGSFSRFLDENRGKII